VRYSFSSTDFWAVFDPVVEVVAQAASARARTAIVTCFIAFLRVGRRGDAAAAKKRRL
jgi:hypothetical protein